MNTKLTNIFKPEYCARKIKILGRAIRAGIDIDDLVADIDKYSANELELLINGKCIGEDLRRFCDIGYRSEHILSRILDSLCLQYGYDGIREFRYIVHESCNRSSKFDALIEHRDEYMTMIDAVSVDDVIDVEDTIINSIYRDIDLLPYCTGKYDEDQLYTIYKLLEDEKEENEKANRGSFIDTTDKIE